MDFYNNIWTIVRNIDKIDQLCDVKDIWITIESYRTDFTEEDSFNYILSKSHIGLTSSDGKYYHRKLWHMPVHEYILNDHNFLFSMDNVFKLSYDNLKSKDNIEKCLFKADHYYLDNNIVNMNVYIKMGTTNTVIDKVSNKMVPNLYEINMLITYRYVNFINV